MSLSALRYSLAMTTQVRSGSETISISGTPGRPRQTGQTFVFGSAPNALAQPHHIFDFVLSWTWVSRPMTASYSMLNLHRRFFFAPIRALLVAVRDTQNCFLAKGLAKQ